MFWRKQIKQAIKQAKENEALVLNLVEKLAPMLTEKLNGILSGSPCYTVKVEKESGKSGNCVIFRIRRGNIPGRSDFNAAFVLLAADDSSVKSIFEIEKHESDRLQAEEYRKLRRVLDDIFGGYRIIKWEYHFGNYYDVNSDRKIKIH